MSYQEQQAMKRAERYLFVDPQITATVDRLYSLKKERILRQYGVRIACSFFDLETGLKSSLLQCNVIEVLSVSPNSLNDAWCHLATGPGAAARSNLTGEGMLPEV